MSPKKLIIALWAAVAAVALAVVFTPSSDGYREFAATQVAPAAKIPAPAVVDAPAAGVKTGPVAAVANAPAVAPSLSLGGVSALLSDASPAPAPKAAPLAANALPAAPAPAALPKDAKLAENPGRWRRASTVSSAEIEAAVERDAMTPETAVAFRSACGHDHDLHFDALGKPLYACSMHIQVGPDTTTYTSTPSYPLADTFLLHSRPTATRKIYLDFNGHVTSGTPWNGGRSATLTTPPFSRDADPEFNDAERAIVQEVFRRVAEHFA
ncbi:MAG: hypothetical protein FJ384_07810, partial [Verrucomicrobia bacterium]|nr:hypothetical protein [Verrucomicrobiota bacterium]